MGGCRACRAAPRTSGSRAQLREVRIALALGAERRRGPVSRIHGRLGRKAFDQHSRGRDQGVPVAAREVDTTYRVGEDEVAREEATVREERDVIRRVAGNRENVEGD